MKSHAQYTVRNIPANIDQSLRARAKASGKSLNEVLVEALTIGAGMAVVPSRDFSSVIGSLSRKEASDLNAEIREQRKIDPRIW